MMEKRGWMGSYWCIFIIIFENVNVWSDGGIITTNNYEYYKKLKLLRNHGLISRDKVEILGFNSRLDTFQACVGNWLLPKARDIANKRIKNAKYLDKGLSKINQIEIPERYKNQKIVFHLYMVYAKNRDNLYKHCLKKELRQKFIIQYQFINKKL